MPACILRVSGTRVMDYFLAGVMLFLAGILGWSAQRASLCTVRAVAEVMTSRSAFMLLTFLKTAAWVLIATAGLAWLAGDRVVPATGYRWSALAAAGGAVFGIGAVVNGGCAFSTLSRLASGRTVVLFSLVGFALGVFTHTVLSVALMLPRPAEMAPLTESAGITKVLVPLVLAWLAWEIVRLSRPRKTSYTDGTQRLYGAPMRLSAAAAWIGISNGVLYALAGPWAYTGTLGQEVQRVSQASEGPGALRWLLLASLFAGAVLAAWHSRRLTLDASMVAWHRHLAGGLLMGLGAALVPGGNDVLLLHGLPSLSPHAIPTLAAMLAGIAGTLFILRLAGRDLPDVYCRRDVCRELQPLSQHLDSGR